MSEYKNNTLVWLLFILLFIALSFGSSSEDIQCGQIDEKMDHTIFN